MDNRCDRRDPAVHATPCLVAHVIGWKVFVDLFPVTDPDVDGPPGGQFAIALQETSWISHAASITASSTFSPRLSALAIASKTRL